jgi:DNA-binding NarL/FixJ family response regulator
MIASVLLVDDHAPFRRLARSLLQAAGFEVVGEAPDGEAALAEAERLHPEVVLLDVQLPGMDGFAVARHLAHLTRPPKVVLVSSRQACDYGPQVEGSSASGFITKDQLTGSALEALIA